MASSVDQSMPSDVAARMLTEHYNPESHHEPHPVTVEDVPDADLEQPLPQRPKKKALDFDSHEAYPELGGGSSKSTAAPSWGTGSSTVKAAPVEEPASVVLQAAPQIKIPGRMVEHIDCRPQDILPREKLRRPLGDVIKDLNRRSRAVVSMSPMANGNIRFEASGPQDIAQQALKDLIQQIGSKSSITFSIPQSVRPFIIGKQGATIKALEDKTGARITFPKTGAVVSNDDEDSEIDVTIEGNTLAAASARDLILKIVKERGANSSTKLRGIPPAFYPFIAGPNGRSIETLEGKHDVKIHLPPATAVAPVGDAEFTASADGPAILLSGDRRAVAQAKAAIENHASTLHKSLKRNAVPIERGRQQYLFGGRFPEVDTFFNKTGCSVLASAADDDDIVTVIGPSNALAAASKQFEELAMSIQCSPIDISRIFRDAPGGPAAHARHITRYLKSRNVISGVERIYNAYIDTPHSEHGALPWQLYVADSSNIIPARSELTCILSSYPPSRVRAFTIDPFFHAHLRKAIGSQVRDDFGVYMVVPEYHEPNAPVVLVYENNEPVLGNFVAPRTIPTAAEISEFKYGLAKANEYVQDLISKQEQLAAGVLEVPLKFHERLRRFIKAENDKLPADQFPVRVTSNGTRITLRGPASAVNALGAKLEKFVEQEQKDELERGFTLSFDFPQKFANHLIGKGGSKIRELRDRFDVEIQVQDGQVELKGPQAKANAAKFHILNLAKTWADETTKVLRVEPKFHRELIGAQGSTINRLQTRYNVHIIFPRVAKASDSGDDDESSDAGKSRRQQAADEVLIRGPSKGVESAYDEIQSLYQYFKEHSYIATLTVKQKQVPSIIGQSGNALEQLRQNTGARIDIPANRDIEDVEITIKGTKAQVQAAEKVLKEQRAIFEDTIVRTIEVDRKHHKALIGAGGSGIRDLVAAAGGSTERRDLARAIQFPKQDSDGNTVKLEGRSEVVEKLITAILSKVEEWASQVTEVLDVPTDKHRALIGRGGETKYGIESQFSVTIEIPRQGDGSTAIKITGRPENVEPAKVHIANLVKEQEGETIMVPRAHHHAISNNGQFFRRLRNDFGIRVDHNSVEIPAKPEVTRSISGLPLITDSPEDQADAYSWVTVNNVSTETGEIPWVLRGPLENMEKAKKAIQTALSQAKDSNVTAFLTLPDTRNYRFIIGPGGSKVKSIRNQSGCRINVPQSNADDQAIEIVGSQANVELARDLILEAVEEGRDKI